MSDVRIRLSEQKRLESSAEGRQRLCRRKLRWQAVQHLRANIRKCSAANSGAVNQRLYEAVAAGAAKYLATWKVGNISERAMVRRCTAVKVRWNQKQILDYFGVKVGCLVGIFSTIRLNHTLKSLKFLKGCY